MRISTCVVGVGRVGLPLALTLADEHDVTCVDMDQNIIDHIITGHMPFHEPGFDDIIAQKKVIPQLGDASKMKFEHDHVVVCIGTPLLSNLEPDLRQLLTIFENLEKDLHHGQHVCLRSTVALGVCEILVTTLERNGARRGIDFAFSYCPERISEGLAKQELCSLPQIVGVDDDLSFTRARELFFYNSKLTRCDVREAELCKIFCNAQRYARFAINNQLAMIAMENEREPHRIFELASSDYPRFDPVRPGYAAGTCLRKDFGFLSWRRAEVDMFLNAWRVNEHLPVFVVDDLRKRGLLKRETKVLLAGITFKRDCDDMRDSLGSKLHRQLRLFSPNIDVVEPMIGAPYVVDTDTGEHYVNNSIETVKTKRYDLIVVGTPHAAIVDLIANVDYNCWISDVWGATREKCETVYSVTSSPAG